MIHNVLDQETESKFSGEEINLPEEGFDYSNVIVKKPWGYEYLVFQNRQVAIWMLHLVRKRKTSMHCHPRKKTSLVLLSGKAKFYHPQGAIELEAMDGVVIGKGVYHSTEAFNPLPINPVSENGIWVMEIESPPQKSDLVRLKDAYGREGKTYEGKDHMVHNPKSCLRIKEPNDGECLSETFFDCNIMIRRDGFLKDRPSDDAMVSVVTKDKNHEPSNPYLSIGGMISFKEFWENVKEKDLSNYTFLVMEREIKRVKAADYVLDCIADLGIKHVFAVSGGGAMHLVDAVGKSDRLQYIATHHEQAASMAAEGYARIKEVGCALVTTGPGGTNTMTGLVGAWIDSIPVIFLSGQVTRDALSEGTGLRQVGIQETNIIELVKPVTKYAVTIKDPNKVKYHIQKAIHMAREGRPGPVWVDIPLDIQSRIINPDELEPFIQEKAQKQDFLQKDSLDSLMQDCLQMLKKAERPVIISGYGIRLAKAENEFREMIELLDIPLNFFLDQ